jgi:heme a synthase
MWLNRFIRLHVVFTFLLIIAGGLVTSTDSGLAVPDWPKSYGTWMPPMVGGILYEHGHRMIASFVGFLTIILAVWLYFAEPRRWVRRVGYFALLAVVAQGILGGITVLYFLPTPISVLHATIAQTFFCMIVSLALFTSPLWKTNLKPEIEVDRQIRFLFLFTNIAIYIQLILGAWMRHSGAALAIPDFPLAFGRLVPEFASRQIAIHYAHRAWAVIVLFLALGSFYRVMRRYRNTALLAPAVLLIGLIFVQIGLGGWTVISKTAVPVATAHVAVGALILATSVVLTIRSYKVRSFEKVRNMREAYQPVVTEAAMRKA